jgi:hypothetical protein
MCLTVCFWEEHLVPIELRGAKNFQLGLINFQLGLIAWCIN